MQNFGRPTIAVFVAVLAAGVGACGQFGEVGNVNLVPRVGQLSRPDWLTYSGGKEQFELRTVGAADLVNADGQCAPAADHVAANPNADGSAQPVPMSGGIALQMTECDVVRRAGTPEQVQVGADERGERSVIITYMRGPRPGIYHFAAGRLTSIERAPEAPGAKAAPKSKPAKKAPRSS